MSSALPGGPSWHRCCRADATARWNIESEMRSSRSPQDGPQVISRLQALFGPNSPSRSGSPAAGLHAGDAVVVHGSSGVDGHVEGESMSRAISAPPVSSGLLNEASSAVREIKEVKDRNALLVKVVTWNMVWKTDSPAERRPVCPAWLCTRLLTSTR